MLPSPLNSLVFEKIDLGTVPIYISRVDVHKAENEGIKLDLDINWDGDCDIELNGSMIPKIVGFASARVCVHADACVRESSMSSFAGGSPSFSAP